MGREKRKYCIVGAGGFARETLTCLVDQHDHAEGRIEDFIVFMVLDKEYCKSRLMNIPVIRQSEFEPEKYEVVVAVSDPQKRQKAVEALDIATRYATLIHPTAVISKWADLGVGSIATAGTIVTCNIEIGAHAHLNLHTSIGHDCRIGDYFTAAPGARISGSCILGNKVYIGTNASVRQDVCICDNVVIGMGSVVLNDINTEGVYAGNPVKKIKTNDL